ncbi:pilus assembly protein [Ornithinimicrobium sp. Y1847]|uniref:pilus assembly protein n=1 Tax=unclassified Ornithinimicrobium TaxID=2615080 RepID=UPI003B676B20
MTVEAAFLLVLLVVPLFYLVATLGTVQAGAYAASAAAREAGRGFVTAQDLADAPLRAHAAAGLVLNAHGVDQEASSLVLTCTQDPCLTPGSDVVVESSVTVVLPLIPDFARHAVPSAVTLSARHVEPVDEFREGG